MSEELEVQKQILEESKKFNKSFEEYKKDSYRELREIKIRLIELTNK